VARESTPTPIYLEVGTKRVFACAFDWPGWCRSGKDESHALEALAAARPRYAAVAREAGIPFETAGSFHVVERLRGSATTDFGAPDRAAAADNRRLTAPQAARLASLTAACWAVFDKVVGRTPAVLRKGPRGGGRDRDAMVDHVLAAEASYARKFGIRLPVPRRGDRAAVAALRQAILDALRGATKTPLVDKGWPPPYLARRIAWHVLDHAWEMEDRSQ